MNKTKSKTDDAVIPRGSRRRTMIIDDEVWRMAGDIGSNNHTEGFRISVKLLHEALSKKSVVEGESKE